MAFKAIAKARNIWRREPQKENCFWGPYRRWRLYSQWLRSVCWSPVHQVSSSRIWCPSVCLWGVVPHGKIEWGNPMSRSCCHQSISKKYHGPSFQVLVHVFRFLMAVKIYPNGVKFCSCYMHMKLYWTDGEEGFYYYKINTSLTKSLLALFVW